MTVCCCADSDRIDSPLRPSRYHRHVVDGAAPSGDLQRLIQLLQWTPHDRDSTSAGSDAQRGQSGWPCVFTPAAWWHKPGPSQQATVELLPHKYYVALAGYRRGTPLQVCSECCHDTHEDATLAVFALRWERFTGYALPSWEAVQSGRVTDGFTLPIAPPVPRAVPYEVRRPLLGYALDNASVTAGKHASFCVSSELPGEITAVFERLLCWDSDPRGPGLETSPTPIAPRSLRAEHQIINAGSYGFVDVAASQLDGKVTALSADGCTMVATIWPTGARKTTYQEGIMTSFAGDAPQAIIVAEFEGGTLSVALTPSGCLALSLNGCELLRLDNALKSRKWCVVGATCKQAPIGMHFSLLAAPVPTQWSADLESGHELRTVQSERTCRLGGLLGVSLGALRREDGMEAHYNGKIAGPAVYGTSCDLVSALQTSIENAPDHITLPTVHIITTQRLCMGVW